jgi:GST-like protein
MKLYTWNTPNGQKPLIAIEELGMQVEVVPINISKNVQKEPWYLAINPNGRIPALLDDDGPTPIRVFESGAVLMHLAEKAGALLPPSGQARADTLAWAFWQVGGPGPMIGQWGFFSRREEKIPVAIERYRDESFRLYKTLELGLSDGRPYLAGDTYSIADIMNWTWIRAGFQFMRGAGETLPELPLVEAWLARVGERPAVERGMARAAALSG